MQMFSLMVSVTETCKIVVSVSESETVASCQYFHCKLNYTKAHNVPNSFQDLTSPMQQCQLAEEHLHFVAWTLNRLHLQSSFRVDPQRLGCL